MGGDDPLCCVGTAEAPVGTAQHALCDCACVGCQNAKEGETEEECLSAAPGALEALYEIKMSGMALVDRGPLQPVARRTVPQLPLEEFKAHALKDIDARCEASRAYLASRTRAKPSEPLAVATAQAILRILTNKRNRRGVASLFDVCRGEYEARLTNLCVRGERICLALPSFPVKCFNPLKVARRMPDLAEAWCLLRMHALCVEIAAVYPPGAYVQLITDGQVYAPIFEEPMEDALAYYADLQHSIEALGLCDTVRLVDMFDLVKERADEYAQERPAARRRVLETWRRHPQIRDDLVANTMGNVNTLARVTLYEGHENLSPAVRGVVGDDETSATYPYDLLRAVLLGRVESAAGVALAKTLRARAEAVALEYATFLETIFALNVVMSKFPSAIRVTCHPKRGQLGLHMVDARSFNYPWNGVAVVYRSVGSQDVGVRVRFEDEVRREEGFTAVYVEGDPFPFYYEKSVDANVRRRNRRKSGKSSNPSSACCTPDSVLSTCASSDDGIDDEGCGCECPPCAD